MSNPLENSKWEVLEGGQETRDCRACTTGMVGQRRCEHPGALALCVACTGPAAGVQGTRRWDSPLAGRVVPTCPQDPGPRAGGRAGCVLRSPREAVSSHSPVPACPRWSAQDGMQRQQTGCRCPETRVLSWARATQHRSQTAQEPEHPPHPPLLNFNRRAVNSPLNPQKPIRAGAAAASQSQCPPPPGPRPLSRDSCRQTKLENQTPWILLPDPLFLSSPSPPSLRGAPCTSALLPEASGCVRRARACGRQRAKAPAQGQGGTGAT